MDLAFRVGFIRVGRQEWNKTLQKRGVDTARDSERDLS